MSRGRVTPTGVERVFGHDQLIVSKTDVEGRITYANELFIELSGYSRHELVGAAHSIVRHPDMPRGVFRLLWDTVMSGKEIFAFVKNMSKNGDHYWVLAHVTPTFDDAGRIVGYHSNRRCPDRRAVAAVAPLYAAMLEAELEAEKGGGKVAGAGASIALLQRELVARKTTYPEFVFTLVGAS